MSAPEESPVRVGGRYRLEERIGAGAMGAVWRATDELLNRTVAAKELLAAAAPATAAGHEALEESRQRIMREGRIGARLNHAHVISMFDVVVHEDRPWLVMEYLPSKSLSALSSEKGPLSPIEVADIGRQIADGLAAAHLAGVVHRDVKPGNVLIAEDGRVKITDFGVSRAVDDVQLTRTGLIAGTPAYLSPEVAQGREPTAASDVFALGATLYATVEGHPPFGLDENPYALLHRVATGVVDPPQQAGPLTGILGRLLSTDPDSRPSAAQARDELAAIAAGRVPPGGVSTTAVFSVGAGPNAPTRPVSHPGFGGPGFMGPGSEGPGTGPEFRPARPAERRRRSPLLLVLLAVLIVAGGVVTFVLTSGSGTGNNPQAVPPAGTTTQAPVTTAPSKPSATPPPSTAPKASTTPAPDVADPVGFVRDYYSLLPGNTDAAFDLLGPSAQAASGGRSGFTDFYAKLDSVKLEDVRQVDATTVDATVVFDPRDGDPSREPYRFVMTTDDQGRTIIESFSRG